MEKIHYLFFNDLGQAESALVAIRAQVNAHAGLFTPLKLANQIQYNHAVIFETESELSKEDQASMVEQFQPVHAMWNERI